jgi:hypothetical protein
MGLLFECSDLWGFWQFYRAVLPTVREALEVKLESCFVGGEITLH